MVVDLNLRSNIVANIAFSFLKKITIADIVNLHWQET